MHGKASGLRAYGGLEFDFEWSEGKLTRLKIRASADAEIVLRLPENRLIPINLKSGETFEL